MIVLKPGENKTPATYLVARQREPDDAKHSIVMTASMLCGSNFTDAQPVSATYTFLRDPDGIKPVKLEGEWAQSALVEKARISFSRPVDKKRRQRK